MKFFTVWGATVFAGRICTFTLLTLLSASISAQTPGDRMLDCAFRINSQRMEEATQITGHGTAFGIDLSDYGYPSPCYLLTAGHNVRDANGSIYPVVNIELRDGHGIRWCPCRVVSCDVARDICVIECSEDLPALAELSCNSISPGSDVILAGSPCGIPMALYCGKLEYIGDDGELWQARIAFDHGCSGGPFYDARSGKVIGVAVAGIGVGHGGAMDRNEGLFVPVPGVRSFLERIRRAVKPFDSPAVAIAARPASPAPPAIVARAERKAEIRVFKPVILESGPAAPVTLAAVEKPAPKPREMPTAPVAMASSKPAPAKVRLPKADIVEVPQIRLPAAEVVALADEPRHQTNQKPAAKKTVPSPKKSLALAEARKPMKTAQIVNAAALSANGAFLP